MKSGLVFLGFFAVLANCADKEELKIDVISKPEVCEPVSKNGDMLTMHYTGTLADGTKFDSSTPHEGHERTFLMIKPDGVQRALVGKIISRFEEKGFKLVAIKFMWPSENLLERHYMEHEGKPFLPGLIKFMASGPVVPMVWEGPNVIKTGRVLIGATNPSQAIPGTIRGDFGLQSGRNLIHGSDSLESAQREIRLWFSEKELIGWRGASESWLYEN